MNEQVLTDKLKDRSARIAVIGLGYVGLPLALTFSAAGFPVAGVDLSRSRIANLRDGVSHLRHVDSSHVMAAIQRPKAPFVASINVDESIADSDCVVICVQTPLGQAGEPDLAHIRSSAELIAPHVRAGMLVVLVSTTYPGTTDDVVRPILERGGLKAGSDFFLAYSPEREDPCNVDFETASIPRVVGGYSDGCLRVALALFGTVICKTIPVSSTSAAEATKLLENTYRAVNIALVNEVKVVYDRLGIDIWEVVKAASSKPFGFAPFYPGPGLGGHCIPIDPIYLTWRARECNVPSRLIDAAMEVNDDMPMFVADKVQDALHGEGRSTFGAHILLLGMAYKRNSDDLRESPSFKLRDILTRRGAEVAYSDPHIQRLDDGGESVELTPESLSEYGCVVLMTDHDAFDRDLIQDNATLIVDTRNFLEGDNVVKA